MESHLRVPSSHFDGIKGILGAKWFSKVAGEWKIVWGPALRNAQAKNWHLTDNAMYMVQSVKHPNQYCIGVSGTNPSSWNGWFIEDLKVSNSVQWPPQYLDLPAPTTDQGVITEGTAVGLEKLWNMTDPRTGETLMQFIQNRIYGTEAEVCVTGHSLGGCLSPVLATAISDKLAQIRQQKPNAPNIQLTTLPSAGPTPGNVAFANHLAANVTYLALVNEYDVVPQAWNFPGMDALLHHYDQSKVGNQKIEVQQFMIQSFIAWANQLPGKNKYVRKPEPQPSTFEVSGFKSGMQANVKERTVGKFAKFLLIGKIRKYLKVINRDQNLSYADVKNFARFFIQMGMEHVAAYGRAKSVGIDLTPAFEAKLEKAMAYTLPFNAKVAQAFLLHRLLTHLCFLAAKWKQNEAIDWTRPFMATFPGAGAPVDTDAEILGEIQRFLLEEPDLTDGLATDEVNDFALAGLSSVAPPPFQLFSATEDLSDN
ncbi:MAG: hypothetical protein AAF570_09315 [Bacteroidota bacterium]